MKQIIYIHGGTVFPDKETFHKTLATWEYTPFEEKKKRIDRLIGESKGQYEIFNPIMPNKYSADYTARKIRFEKTLAFLNNEDLIVIGHSLGGIFVIKYLLENGFPKKIKQLHLVASVVDENNLPKEDKYLGDFLFYVNNIPKLENLAEQIYVYHSTDDPTVPYSHAEKIMSYLPKAKLITFTDRGHFSQAEFPEVLENILHG